MALNRKFSKRKNTSEQMVLQITSMADIFTIILVFLLKTFSTGVSSITPSGDLVLPSAKAELETAEVMKLEISSDAILLDDKPVTVLKQFVPERSDVERDGTLRSLNVALGKLSTQRRSATEPENVAHLMILADRLAPYGIIKSAVQAAANGGVQEFKLAVVKEEE